MSLYDLNFNQKAVELLPPDKRMTIFAKWVQALLSQNTWNHTKIFVDYKTGANYLYYVPAATYNAGDRVIYGQAVYECLINGTTTTPEDTTRWVIYQNNFVGTDERVAYNHEKIVLEYALNRRFLTTFRQPPLISDIYIQKNTKGLGVFIVGAVEAESSATFYDQSAEFIINDYAFTGTYYNFTVFVPLAVYEAVSASPTAREGIFRNFIDLYNTIGLNYNIQTY
jgi:hypothetical protein